MAPGPGTATRRLHSPCNGVTLALAPPVCAALAFRRARRALPRTPRCAELTPRAPPISQSYVFVYVQLPPGVEPRQARVDLTPHSLAVHIGDERVLSGPLFAPIKAEESVWLISARPPPAGASLPS